MMRLTSNNIWVFIAVVAMGVVSLVTLLTFTRQIDQSQHRQVQGHLQQLYRLDAAMDQSLGLVQHGMLTHYDSFVQYSLEINQILKALDPAQARSGLSRSDEMVSLYQGLLKSWQEKLWLVERFKSDQAVLRNSLRYFPQALMEITEQLDHNKPELTGFDANQARVMSRQLTLLLRLTLVSNNRGPEQDLWALGQSQELILTLLEQHQGTLVQQVRNLMEHGALIHKFQMKVNRWSQDAVAQPTERQLDRLAESYYAAFEGDLRRADQLRLWMYLLTLVLIGVGMLVARKVMLLRLAHAQQEALVAQRTTELRRELLERRKAEERFRSVAESAGDAILAVDRHGRISFWNRSATTIFGYEYAQVKGRSLEMLVPEHQQSFYQHILQASLKADALLKPREVQTLEAQRADGTIFPVEASLASWKTGGKRFFTLVIRDITERKAMEDRLHATLNSLDAKVAERTSELQSRMDELNRTRDQLVSSEKMASIGRLAAGVAHEINTPIGIAVGAASQNRETTNRILAMLEQEEVDEESLVEELKSLDKLAHLISNSMEKAAKLIRVMRRFTHISTDWQLEPLDMESALLEIVDPLRPMFDQQHVVLQIKVEQALQVMSRKDLVQEIFSDLLNNTLVHAFPQPGGGEVKIVISYVEGEVLLNYQDDGIGMDEVVQQQMFEPFFTTAHPEGRYGLGLYFLQTLVQGQLQGRVLCQSGTGEGVRFEICWPCERVLVQP
ncbi:multi-sensor signal transduction histidine kinase [Magnetococcus marinus MC-1]|uniref:histidine kinase n=1 Tax=Magnetococcus marinus (strain ATCC BAA-1437 / JCM 17883 / MC-1) TaxID=156889 RepID=A0L7Q5_MAGMM|nr:DAHL domain-containing protein [Magnetococcus marinus]ABK43998.1 multi-sensor signal transduction histidine kinase [Magnetococcus marinus MC-1]